MHRTTAFLAFALTLCLSLRTHAQLQSSTTLGGYGELHYNEPDGPKRGELDFHRFVLYLSHQFSDRVSFSSELELEHTLIEAGESEGGELSIEQAFLDYRLFDSFGVRGGIVLAPVGIVNLYHEPPTFHGVERPSVDRVVIPTTWRETGVGVYGTLIEQFSYQLYLVAGLDASGFGAGDALRGGRQKGFRSNPANPSATGRIGYTPLAGLLLGASFFAGSAAADHDSIGSTMVTLWSGDVRWNLDPLVLRAAGALGSIGDATQINAKFGRNVADRFHGYYVEGAYNILWHLAPSSDQTLDFFVRYEQYDTQAATSGFAPLLQYDRNDFVFGFTYKPTFNTVVKCDYVFLNNALNDEPHPNTGQFNVGIGYAFN